MIGLKHRRRREREDDVELDMVPIMNMFLVLIPFLLMSASFFQLKVIHTSVPVLSSQKNASDSAAEKKKKIKLTVIVEIGEKGVHLSAMSDTAGKDALDNVEKNLNKGARDEWPMEELSFYLKEIKAQYPESDTVIIIPGKDILYETIIKTMDVARNSKESPMFPKVVLSGKIT